MKRIAWPVFSITLVLILMAVFLYRERDALAALQGISFRFILLLICLQSAVLVVNGVALRIIAAKFSIHLKTREWLGLSFMTTLGNAIAPFSGGLIARAAYLKRRHGFSYTQFGTSLAASYLINFTMVSVSGLMVLIALHRPFTYFRELTGLFLAALLILVCLMLTPFRELTWNNRLIHRINDAIRGWSDIRGDRALVSRLSFCALLNILLGGVMYQAAYRSYGLEVPFDLSLLVYLLASFSLLINLTPGNFGIQEVIVAISSGLFGVGAAYGVIVSLLLRLTGLLVAFTLGLLFSYLLTRELNVKGVPTAHTPENGM
ncbi:MAG TPA: lysylphosphatidylglycerol synthase transmembrane domain-containing protein [Syntrophales bacterium]|nr:lysylphosphatidylglycerol synthase transmembrane domain-containing protein [Syntrophales bacterium]HOX94580.1 lysylphosphatidylglycerol synthase transmembrane domain-containing protein [Syntrophales bacterium]HPI56390.1 lysylphosphatidylglycerol synthase transmembrane domain-containing protein [Syntrophales bacterium]HPN24223.1 lysylphosphatidylglycerol synthase transmembrane domain-containing protein [Syntrophales bacterium]HQM28576.1 lysylphosphatidylglycerol synthase transmembrane domain-